MICLKYKRKSKVYAIIRSNFAKAGFGVQIFDGFFVFHKLVMRLSQNYEKTIYEDLQYSESKSSYSMFFTNF